MELYNYKDYFFTIQRKGNDRNGNPIFLVNIFHDKENYNCNWLFTEKMDKAGNIVIKNYKNIVVNIIKNKIDNHINK